MQMTKRGKTAALIMVLIAAAASAVAAPWPPLLGPQSTCPAPPGPGTTHGGVTTPQNWTAAASPHLVTGDISINAQLILEPCAIVRIAAGTIITISSTGQLIASGAPGSPVTIDSMAPGQGWGTIRNVGGVLR
jgi:hypothetical protein